MADDTILIWGAGAIGGTVGAYLRRDGLPVLFVDRSAEHVDAMRHGGLQITGPIEEFQIPAPACMPADLTGRFKRAFLCVKAHDTEDAIDIAPLERMIAPGGRRCVPRSVYSRGTGSCATSSRVNWSWIGRRNRSLAG